MDCAGVVISVSPLKPWKGEDFSSQSVTAFRGLVELLEITKKSLGVLCATDVAR